MVPRAAFCGWGKLKLELHISNNHRREPIYHNSLVSPVATAVIAGLGPQGYISAVSALLGLLEDGTGSR